MKGKAYQVLHTLDAIANTSKALTIPDKAQIWHLSIEGLTLTEWGQLGHHLEHMSWGCTTMAASVSVSQLKIEYEEVEAT
jgi:hypothetical protein